MKHLSLFITLALFFFLSCTPNIKKASVSDAPPTPPQESSESTQTTTTEAIPATDEEIEHVQDLIDKIFANKVFFEFDKTVITEEGKKLLAEVADIMNATKAGRKISIDVAGHTDEVGTEEYNLVLGEKRAKAVMEYLESYGVNSDRINFTTYGEESPAVQGKNEEARAQNRRAEFKAKSTVKE
ncbi:MAG: OmpA family protein [Fibrobacteria bacterium]|nr:OmpA family protein [Fibrobacteria bacterium]